MTRVMVTSEIGHKKTPHYGGDILKSHNVKNLPS
jgi:hypothetical protein